MDDEAIIIKAIRPGIVEYYDLCEHKGTVTNDFFQKDKLIKMRTMGLVMEEEGDDFTPATVKILHIEDLEGSANSDGIVIPKSVVTRITYLAVDEELDSDTIKKDPSGFN